MSSFAARLASHLRMTESPMLARLLFVLLLALGSASAFAAEQPKGPLLAELMKQPHISRRLDRHARRRDAAGLGRGLRQDLGRPPLAVDRGPVGDDILHARLYLQAGRMRRRAALRAVLAGRRQGLGLAAHRRGEKMARRRPISPSRTRSRTASNRPARPWAWRNAPPDSMLPPQAERMSPWTRRLSSRRSASC